MKPKYRRRLIRVERNDRVSGWDGVFHGREVRCFDSELRQRENNILQFAVCYIMRVRPSWLRRFGVPKTLSLRNLARLELTEF